jgi:hypothetical protein
MADEELGTYAYQFCFLLPGTLPPTLHVPHGSVAYNLRATVYRHSTSSIIPLPHALSGHSSPSTLTATQEVSLVSFPRADLEQEGEEDPGCALQGDWRDRLSVRAHVSPGRVPIGGDIMLTLDITPAVQMKVWGISAVLEGQLYQAVV